MRRFLFVAMAGVLLGLPGIASSGPIELGIIGYGGYTVPVLQDVSGTDEILGESGTQFGLRAPVKLIPVVTLEPYFAMSSYGTRTEEIPEGSGLTYSRDGWDATAFGLNVLLGNTLSRGFSFFPRGRRHYEPGTVGGNDRRHNLEFRAGAGLFGDHEPRRPAPRGPRHGRHR